MKEINKMRTPKNVRCCLHSGSSINSFLPNFLANELLYITNLNKSFL